MLTSSRGKRASINRVGADRDGDIHKETNMNVAIAALVLGILLAAPLPVRADHSVPARPASATPALNDANIAAIVLAANTIDIANGELAIARSKHKAVREFARRMMTDHASVNAKAGALAARLGLRPVENAASRGLVASTDSTRQQLRRLKGAAFDRAYVENEVAYHQAVLDLLDSTIVPAVENTELRALLVGVRPAFVAHLEHAKMIHAGLAR
jgi:putative membrane protein